MSYDRNANGLESPLQRFDRLFFCRSFHSKLFPVGGLCLEQDRRVAPIVLPGSSRDTSSLDTSGTTTLRKPALSNRQTWKVHPNEVSRFEPNPLPPPQRQRVTKSGFHPSVQEIKRDSPEGEPCTCSLGQDRSLLWSPKGPRRPLFVSSYKTAGCHPFIEQSMRSERRGMVSYLFDIRKTNTDVPTTASTPGKECLTSLNGVAKGILAFGSIFRARSPASWPTSS